MKTCHIQTPVGIAKITGNEDGVSEISISNEGIISDGIPVVLEEAISQLKDYFDKKRISFDFKINPKGTEFQQKVWQELLNIPFVKTVPLLI